MNQYGWFESCNIQEYFHRNQGIICLQGRSDQDLIMSSFGPSHLRISYNSDSV